MGRSRNQDKKKSGAVKVKTHKLESYQFIMFGYANEEMEDAVPLTQPTWLSTGSIYQVGAVLSAPTSRLLRQQVILHVDQDDLDTGPGDPFSLVVLEFITRGLFSMAKSSVWLLRSLGFSTWVRWLLFFCVAVLPSFEHSQSFLLCGEGTSSVLEDQRRRRNFKNIIG